MKVGKKALLTCASLVGLSGAAIAFAVAQQSASSREQGTIVSTAAGTPASSPLSAPSSGLASAPPAVAAGAPSPAYTLAFADEFNGTQVDQNDWYFRITGRYTDGYNRRENVTEEGGALKIRYDYEDVSGDGVPDFTAGGVISRHLFGYGYYEVRARLHTTSTGLHTSFWSMGILANKPGIGSDPLIAQDINNGVFPENNQLYEIDGFEHDSPDTMDQGTNKQSSNATTRRAGGKSSAQLGINFADWNVYGFDYQPDATRFYLNGVLTYTIDNTTNAYVFAPANLWLTALMYFSNPTPGVLPGGSEFDYFRFYNKPSPGTNRLGNANFDALRSTIPLWIPGGWIEGYDKPASAISEADHYDGTRSLLHQSTSAYLVTTKQNLTYLPNGSYTLSAWVKSSGGQSQARMRVLNSGVAERYVDIPQTSAWTQITIPNVIVSNGKATIAFTSNAAANQWLKVDNVSFREQ